MLMPVLPVVLVPVLVLVLKLVTALYSARLICLRQTRVRRRALAAVSGAHATQ